MSVAGEPGGRARQMRAKAQELKEAAERATDPDQRQRLQDKARRLREQSEKESGMQRIRRCGRITGTAVSARRPLRSPAADVHPPRSVRPGARRS